MPQLVLIPGLACDDRLWQAQWPALPASMAPTVTDVHMRLSTIEDMAATLLAEHEGPLVLCGASMGGMIAMEAARQAPARIEGLALLGTSARPETPDMRALREAAIELYERDNVRGVVEPNVPFAFHPTQAADPRLVDAYLQMMLDAGGAQLIRQNRAVMQRPDARRHLADLRCPVLVMCGDTDRLTPPDCSEEIAALAPGAALVRLEACGHMLTMEKPEQVNTTLGTWLARFDD